MKTVKSGPGIDHISDIIDIHKLEHESRRYLLFGFIIAIFFHGMLGVCIKFERVKVESEQVHSIPVKLLTIPEDIDQPLVIGRRQFHPRKLERKHSTSQTPDGHIDSRTHMPYGSGESFGTEDFGAEKYTSESLIPGEGEQPRPNGFGIENEGIARIPDRHRAFRDEWVSIDDLDNGRYKSIIIHDPKDKTNIKGYVHVPISIWGSNLKPAAETRGSIANLEEGFFRYTGMYLKVDSAIYLTSPELKKYPFIYITADDLFDTLPFEARMIKEYLDKGGFALLEPYGLGTENKHFKTTNEYLNASEDRAGIPYAAKNAYGWLRDNDIKPANLRGIGLPKAAPPMKQMVRDVLGEDVCFTIIPDDHDVFHSVFDAELDDLDGVFREGRLVLIYSLKGLGKGWVSRSPLALKAGVNMIVYALETGGIAQQMIDDSTEPIQNSRQWWDINERLKHRDNEKSNFNPEYKKINID